MSGGFIRSEARAVLWRWREALSGVALAVGGLWAALGPGGLLGGVGWFVAAVGAGLAIGGIQRGRLRGLRGGGPGAVDVDEGQITYFGPLTGGAISLPDLIEIALVRKGQSPHWHLRAAHADLHIPVDAEGADALLDAFAGLPRFRAQRMIWALQSPEAAEDVVIWRLEAP